MRGEPADGAADGIVTRGPSPRLVPSLDQDVVTGPAVEGVLPQPADQDTEAPNASPVTRMDSLPLVPLTMTRQLGGRPHLCGTWSFSPRITG